jgi:hypothetical protein
VNISLQEFDQIMVEDILKHSIGHLEDRLRSGKISQLDFRSSYLFIQNHLDHLKIKVDPQLEELIRKSTELRSALARGESGLSQQFLNIGAKEDRIHQERDTPVEELEALREKWRAGTEDNRRFKGIQFDLSKDYPNSPFSQLKLTVTQIKPEETGKLFCSFCSQETNHLQATISKKHSAFKVSTLEVDHEGNDVVGEKIVHKNGRVVACPSCSLKITPKVDRSGRVTNTVQFSSLEDQ